MQELRNTSCTLEIQGPRGQVWRPAPFDMFGEAQKLADAGRTYESLLHAQDTYIGRNGDMHGVDFRVVTREVTVTVIGALNVDSLTQLMAASGT